MVIDEETRRTIIDLYSSQHKTIRQITRITRKSGRDIAAILKERNGKSRTQAYEVDDKNQGLDSIEEPLNAKAYRLFSQGKSPLQVLEELRISETETTKYYMEYLRLSQLPGLSLTFKELGSVRAVSFFAKLSNIAVAEGLTVEEVIRLLRIVKNNPLFSVEARIEEIKKMRLCLESELEEQKNMLFCYNEKIDSAKLILKGWNIACKEIREEVIRIHHEKQILENLVHLLKQNDNLYQKIQNIAEDKVSSFLTGYNGMKLLQFALLSVCEALRQDPQKEHLIEKMPQIQIYDFDPSSVALDQPPFQNPYDDYPHIAKDKVLELSKKYYNRLINGLTDCSISTAAEMGRY
jgi:hypothetical protein